MTPWLRYELDGYPVFELRSDTVAVGVMPDLGAKLVNLQSRRSGRQWLWASGRRPQYWSVPTGTPFDQGPLAGADECLPTVAPCRWRGRDLPDHGELWTERWQLDEARLGDGEIVTRLSLPISPLRLERSVRVRDAEVRFAYVLTSIAAETVEYAWAFHPMLNIVAGDTIQLPASCRWVRTETCWGDCPLGERGDRWPWPHPAAGVDLARLDLGAPRRAVKLFTEPLAEGRAVVRNERTGDVLTLDFDVAELDTLGIWINRGAFGGYQHFALEPTNGAPDALDLAVTRWRRHGQVEPGGRRTWSFTLTLD